MLQDEYVISAIHQWFLHNQNEYKSRSEIQNLSRVQQLELFLEWEGIIGYTNHILNIFRGNQNEII